MSACRRVLRHLSHRNATLPVGSRKHVSVGSKSAIRTGVVAAVLAMALGADAALAADRIVAASLGDGTIELLWVPEDGNWPAGGWRLARLADTGGGVIAEGIGPASDPTALAAIDAEAAAGIADFAAKLQAGTLSEDEVLSADTVLIVAAVTRYDYGRALGLRFRDTNVPAGQTSYRLTALDARGAALRVVESDPVDAATVTPLPFPPEAVAVDIVRDGFAVSWSEPPNMEELPIVGYRLVRVVGDGETDLTPDLHLRSTTGLGEDRPERLVFLDTEPVRDRPSAYDVTTVDVYGRSSAAKRVEVPLGAIARAVVPEGLTAAAEVEAVALAWSPNDRPGVGGYVVERSLFAGGPYEVLTPDGLARDTTAFDSAGLSPGTSYFFRVRIFDEQGALGRPSLPVKASPRAAGPPAAPANVSAEGGVTRVAISWGEPPTPVAGFFVYRRVGDDSDWQRLNGRVTPETVFHDRFERGAFDQAQVFYRVQAVGYDNQQGPFSAEVAVTFGDVVLPPAPVVTAVSGDDGVARVSFEPGAPAEDAAQFLAFRADEERAPGLVVGEPLPPDAREFVDVDVMPGSVHWYEIAALDAAGNRSDASNRVVVAIGAPPLPTPPAPEATFHATPFRYVELTLALPPEKARAVIEAREGDGKWLVVAGPVAEIGTINLTSLPTDVDEIAYRVVYQAVNGARGPPSETVAVALR